MTEPAPDEVPMPTVTAKCRICKVTDAEVESGYVVVSPSGVAHHGGDFGMTACGHDAAGLNYRQWWWPL